MASLPKRQDDEFTVSFSQLALYRESPDYELRRLRVPGVTTPNELFGTLIHAVLHDVMQRKVDGQRSGVRAALAIWQEKWRNSGGRLQTDHPELYEYGRTMVRNYVKSPLFTDAQIYQLPSQAKGAETGLTKPALEYSFKIPMGNNVFLVGRFDRVDIRNGLPVVVDYKTGSSRDESTLRDDPQLRLYAMAIAYLTGTTAVTCEIHWLKPGTVPPVAQVHFNQKQLRAARRDAIKLCQKLKEAHFSGNPLPVPRHTRPVHWDMPAAAPLPDFPRVLGQVLATRGFDAASAQAFLASRPRHTPDYAPRSQRIDAEITPREVSLDLYYQLQRLAPYGVGNPTPLLLMRNVEVVHYGTTGKDPDSHPDNLRLTVRGADGKQAIVVAWRSPELRRYLESAKSRRARIDICCEIDLYRGLHRDFVDVTVRGWREARQLQERTLAA